MSTPSPYNITVPDSSPLFHYSPYGDGDSSGGWNVTYSGIADSSYNDPTLPSPINILPNGTSSHRTTSSGATIDMSWTGTGVTLLGGGSAGAYQTVLDSSEILIGTPDNGQNILAVYSGLSYGNHSIELKLLQPSQLTFSGAQFTIGIGQPGCVVHQAIFYCPQPI